MGSHRKNPHVVGTNGGRSQGHILTYVVFFFPGAPHAGRTEKKKNAICQNMSLAPPLICAHHMWVFPIIGGHPRAPGRPETDSPRNMIANSGVGTQIRALGTRFVAIFRF